MKQFTYVTNTWLLSVLFHALIWTAWLWNDEEAGGVGFFLTMFPISLLFSAPAYLLCLWWINRVIGLHAGNFGKLCGWIIGMVCTIALSLQVVFLFIGGGWIADWDDLSLVVPGVISGLLSTLMRYKQFRSLLALKMNYKEINQQDV